MKRLWVKYLSLILILGQTSILFADTLKFVNGSSITGKYIEENTNGVIFQLDRKQQIPQVAILNELDDMNSIINANVKNQVNKSESLNKTANILTIGSCIGFAIYFLFFYVSPAG